MPKYDSDDSDDSDDEMIDAKEKKEGGVSKKKIALGVGVGIALLLGGEELLDSGDEEPPDPEHYDNEVIINDHDEHGFSNVDPDDVHNIFNNDDYNTLMHIVSVDGLGEPTGGVLSPDEWEELTNTWKYLDIHPFFLKSNAGGLDEDGHVSSFNSGAGNAFATLSVTSDRLDSSSPCVPHGGSAACNFMNGYLVLKYNGLYHDISDQVRGDVDSVIETIDSIVG
tara:strand:- start:3860 stop:4531 length:672 start_codon:yes stop_codon:yes gene_type:complete